MTNLRDKLNSSRALATAARGALFAIIIAMTAALAVAQSTPREGEHETPTPTPSPSPTASPSPTPSATPSPTPTATPTPAAFAEIETRLVGAPLNGATPEGEAELEREDEGTSLKVKVEHVNLPDGTILNVLVDNTKIGEIVLSGGSGEIRFRTDRGQEVPPIVNGTNVAVTNAAGATILSGAFTSSLPKGTPTPTPTPNPTPQPGADVRVRIPLAGAAIGGMIPQGHADFRSRADGRTSFEVEIEDVNLPAGTVFDVLVGGTRVGSITLNSLLHGELEFESEHGQTVPAITQGTTVTVVNAATGATILAGAFGSMSNAPNPLDDVNFFVRQQYVDFLNRAPDQGGFDTWTGILGACPANGYGLDNPRCDRAAISTGFFRSQEFSGRGYFVYRLYDAAMGRLPHYNEFVSDLADLGLPGTQAELDAAKSRFAAELEHRAEFQGMYGDVDDAAHAEDFVTRLEHNAGVTLANHAQLVDDMRRGARTPEDTLRAFLESAEVDHRFFTRGFVSMQYFGYLRRDADPQGFNDWVNYLAAHPDDSRSMIYGFVHSGEYRNRFGQN